MRRKSPFFSVALVLACFVTAGFAGYPAPVDDYVNDYASMLNEADRNTIREMLSGFEKKTGVEMAVVAISSVKDYQADADIEKFSTGLFNAWGIGHKEKNNGVLMLVAVNDRKLRIELGAGYDDVYNAVMAKVIERDIIPHFKRGDMSRGVYEGTRGVISSITREVSFFEFYWLHIIVSVLIVVCVLAGLNMIKNGKKGWGFVFFAAAGLLLIFLLKLLASGKSRRGFGGGGSFGGGASGRW
ncbi:MAG TPA: TPM domain-containing protein [bacterium]|nr:TPM domain-containing protein [bacterium]